MKKLIGCIIAVMMSLTLFASSSFAGWSDWKPFTFGENSESYYITPDFEPGLDGEKWHQMKFKKKVFYNDFTTAMEWTSDDYPGWHNFYNSTGSSGSAVCYSGSADVKWRIIFSKQDSTVRKGYWAEYTDDE